LSRVRLTESNEDRLKNRVQRIALVLWPSFIVGGIGTTCFFALFDPAMLPLSDAMLPFSESRLAQHRMLIYTVGFFIFWLFAAASSWLTSFLQRSPDEVNLDSITSNGDRNADDVEK
jgi:cation transporter-like permease